MPEYLAPGVYIEETSFRAKSIEGVSTTTTGFVGPAAYGPVDLPNELVTSLSEFALTYGDGRQLNFHTAGVDSTRHNYLWHGVRAFFEEGGKRLYISRIFRNLDGGTYLTPEDLAVPDPNGGLQNDGHARGSVGDKTLPFSLRIRARYPGAAGNYRVRFTLRLGPNVLSFGKEPAKPAPQIRPPRVASLLSRDVVFISHASSPVSKVLSGDFYLASFDSTDQDWHFTPHGGGTVLRLGTDISFSLGHEIRQVTLSVSVQPGSGLGLVQDWSDIALDKDHQQNGARDSLIARFGRFKETPARNREIPIVIAPSDAPTDANDSKKDGLDVLAALFAQPRPVVTPPLPSLADALKTLDADADSRSVDLLLSGGNDGGVLDADDYEGHADADKPVKTGLKQFEDIDDISIVAAPGYSFNYENGNELGADTVAGHLISHCARMRYRIAVLDSGNGQTLSQVQKLRGKLDSTYAALYYPWVRVLDPITRLPIYLPPSGFVAGIYARNDITRAVYKAPANEVVNLSLGFEITLNKAQQDVLNPVGINCFRFFEGRGNRLWGARTISSDPEWKYVSLRRYFAYLEHSIDRGTQWAVFEPNGELLWANVRRTIEDFLFNEWQNGAYLGTKPETSYFVRCDRTTMTQNDLDNGRLVCLIGVAVVRPAEFVIFRIGQWTADRK